MCPRDLFVSKKGGGFYLLECKNPWRSQTIINHTNECEIAPVTGVVNEAPLVL